MYAIQQQLPGSGRWMTVAIVRTQLMADMLAAHLIDDVSMVRCRVQRIGQSGLANVLTSWQPSATVPS